MEPPRAHQTAAQPTPATFKWKTAVALILLLIAIVFNLSWAFGLLFVAWAIADIMSGRAYFVEEVTKAENPILFWTIVILWLLLGFYSLLEPFLWPTLN